MNSTQLSPGFSSLTVLTDRQTVTHQRQTETEIKTFYIEVCCRRRGEHNKRNTERERKRYKLHIVCRIRRITEYKFEERKKQKPVKYSEIQQKSIISSAR